MEAQFRFLSLLLWFYPVFFLLPSGMFARPAPTEWMDINSVANPADSANAVSAVDVRNFSILAIHQLTGKRAVITAHGDTRKHNWTVT
jgi:hypothetical protein